MTAESLTSEIGLRPTDPRNPSPSVPTMIVGQGEVSASIHPEPQLPEIPGYYCKRFLGRGGMGIVYLAEQIHLRRECAVKVLLKTIGSTPLDNQRFRNEAQALAKIQHPGIVQIYEVGEFAGTAYISLEYCSGGSLADRLDGKPLPAREAARIILRLAMAIQAAHAANIIHRDLKPGNVLFAADGMLKITDFGLAKQMDGDGVHTRTGEILGTPHYMAPEQVGGRVSSYGPAIDIWSLGVMLYELLTGRLPFVDVTPLEILMKILREEPIAPRQYVQSIPRDLETICLKCLEKPVHRRYSSASALAEDLRSFLDGKTISARPVKTPERLWRWTLRNRLVACLVLLLIVGFIGTLVGSLVAVHEFAALAKEEMTAREKAEAYGREAEQRRREAELNRAKAEEAVKETRAANEKTTRAKEEADRQRDHARKSLYFSRVAQANINFASGNPETAARLLTECEPRDDLPDLRGWEWYHLRNVLQAELYSLPPLRAGQQLGWINELCFSPDGRYLAIGCRRPNYLPRIPGVRADLKIWDLHQDRLAHNLTGTTFSITGIAFRPDGREIMVTDTDFDAPIAKRHIRASSWSLPDGVLRRQPEESPNLHQGFLLRPADWDPARLSIRRPFGNTAFPLIQAENVVALHEVPGHSILRILEQGGRFCEFRTDTGELVKEIGRLDRMERGSCRGAFSEDGRFVAWWQVETGILNIHDGRTGKFLAQFSHLDLPELYALAFTPDGSLMAYGGYGARIHVIDTATMQETASLLGHKQTISALRFSPDGSRLASGDWMGHVKVWDLQRRTDLMRLHTRHVFTFAIAFRQEKEQLTFVRTSTNDKDQATNTATVDVWDAWTGGNHKQMQFADSAGRPIESFQEHAFSHDGRYTAVITPDRRSIKVLDFTQPEQYRQIEVPPPAEVRVVALDRAGNLLCLAGSVKGRPLNGFVLFIPLHKELRVKSIPTPGIQIQHASVSPDGRFACLSGDEFIGQNTLRKTAMLYDTEAKKLLGKFFALCSAFSADGKTLALANDRQVLLIDTATGQLIRQWEYLGLVEALAFNPSGDRLAGSSRGQVTLWDTGSGEEAILLSLVNSKTGRLFRPQVAFSPDGKLLAAVHSDGSIFLWSGLDRTPERLTILRNTPSR